MDTRSKKNKANSISISDPQVPNVLDPKNNKSNALSTADLEVANELDPKKNKPNAPSLADQEVDRSLDKIVDKGKSHVGCFAVQEVDRSFDKRVDKGKSPVGCYAGGDGMQQLPINTPPVRTPMTRNIMPLSYLSPYQTSWTIKVHVTSISPLRMWRKENKEGYVFTVILTDEHGTEIQAKMFNDYAKTMYEKLQQGKVYYISKGSVGYANKKFNTVRNTYEISLTDKAVVEEVTNEEIAPPKQVYAFVAIDRLEDMFNHDSPDTPVVVDVIGVIQKVATSSTIKRKSDGEIIEKREITIADHTQKSVIVTLWKDLSATIGEQLMDCMSKGTTIVAMKSLLLRYYNGGYSLSTLAQTNIQVDPNVDECIKLRLWYDTEGHGLSFDGITYSLKPSMKVSDDVKYRDRVFINDISNDYKEKVVYISIQASLTFITLDQNFYYRSCNFCRKKVLEGVQSAYWCNSCKRSQTDCILRYSLFAKFADATGELFLTLFDEEAEKVLGCKADALHTMRSQDGSLFELQLKKSLWIPYLLRLSVGTSEYKGTKRQKISVKGLSPVDYAANTKFLLQDIATMQTPVVSMDVAGTSSNVAV